LEVSEIDRPLKWKIGAKARICYCYFCRWRQFNRMLKWRVRKFLIAA